MANMANDDGGDPGDGDTYVQSRFLFRFGFPCVRSVFVSCLYCRPAVLLYLIPTPAKKPPQIHGGAGIFGLCSVCVRCDPSVLRLCPTLPPIRQQSISMIQGGMG